MPLTVRVGFDSDVLGEYRLRDGRIEIVADNEETKKSLEQRLDTCMRRMVEDAGFDPETITAEQVLRWIPENTAQGRNWMELVEEKERTK